METADAFGRARPSARKAEFATFRRDYAIKNFRPTDGSAPRVAPALHYSRQCPSNRVRLYRQFPTHAASSLTLTGDVRCDKPRTSFGNRFLRNGFVGIPQYGAKPQIVDRNRERDKRRIYLGLLAEVALAKLDFDRKSLRFPLSSIEFQDQKAQNHEHDWKVHRSQTKSVSADKLRLVAFWDRR